MFSAGRDFAIFKIRQLLFSQYLCASVRPAGGAVRDYSQVHFPLKNNFKMSCYKYGVARKKTESASRTGHECKMRQINICSFFVGSCRLVTACVGM
jgi:hypothetical protein